MWRDTAEELLASNDEQKHLIDSLLALADSERGLDRWERSNLETICQTVLKSSGLDAERLALHVEANLRPAALDGDPKLVERLVANLIDNAISHNVAGGHVHVSTYDSDRHAVLKVTNTGPVIPSGEIDRLFRPFQRLDPRRSHHQNGHGLGLSIVRAIAATHHAVIGAHALPEGGLGATVTFPPPAGTSDNPNKGMRSRKLATSQP